MVAFSGSFSKLELVLAICVFQRFQSFKMHGGACDVFSRRRPPVSEAFKKMVAMLCKLISEETESCHCHGRSRTPAGNQQETNRKPEGNWQDANRKPAGFLFFSPWFRALLLYSRLTEKHFIILLYVVLCGRLMVMRGFMNAWFPPSRLRKSIICS